MVNGQPIDTACRLEVLSDLHGTLADCIFNTVVKDAVVKYQFHVADELVDVPVGVAVDSLLDCSEIHGIFYDLEVVEDTISLWVDRLMKNMSTLEFPARCDYF